MKAVVFAILTCIAAIPLVASAQPEVTMEQVAAIALPTECYDIVLHGDYGFIPMASAGLLVLDLTDPEHPAVAGMYDSIFNVNAVRIQDDYAYFIGTTGFAILDISDLSTISFLGYSGDLSWATDLAVHGDYAYVTDVRFGVRVFNVADKTNPVVAGEYPIPGSSSTTIAAEGNLVLVDAYQSGLHTLDVFDPSSPVLLSRMYNPDIEGYAQEIVIDDGFAYSSVASPFGNWMWVVRCPEGAPSQWWSEHYGMTAFVIGGVSTQGSYVLWSTIYGLFALNVADRRHPYEAGTWGTEESWIYYPKLAGDYAYIPSGDSLKVLSVYYHLRGDANGDRGVSAPDIIYLVNHLFKGGAAPKFTAQFGDVSCDGMITSSDVLRLVAYVFKGASAESMIWCN